MDIKKLTEELNQVLHEKSTKSIFVVIDGNYIESLAVYDIDGLLNYAENLISDTENYRKLNDINDNIDIIKNMTSEIVITRRV